MMLSNEGRRVFNLAVNENTTLGDLAAILRMCVEDFDKVSVQIKAWDDGVFMYTTLGASMITRVLKPTTIIKEG